MPNNAEPTFDDFDAGIFSERQRARWSLSGPLVGDFIRRKDGMLARITQIWTDHGAQTTTFSDDGEGGRFYLNRSGAMDYSGSLQPSIPFNRLRPTSDRREGWAWFFHHGESRAHNGVDFKMRVQIWDLLDDHEARDSAIPARYILGPGGFKGSIQTTTYTTLDGVERVMYSQNQPLADYLAENPGVTIVSDSELDAMTAAYYASMVTAPSPITKEHYWDMLECLPPCRYGTIGGATVFHVSERLTGNLVQWCAKIGESYYGWTDQADITTDDLRAKLDAITNQKGA